MGINVQSVEAHHDHLYTELESYKNKPTINAITETWLSKHANLKVSGKPKYQPVLSNKSKTSCHDDQNSEVALHSVKFGPGSYRIFSVIEVIK